jgi:Uma2 family endonuclease
MNHMADTITTTSIAAGEQTRTAEAFTPAQELPLEQRTDVTVAELERLSLPHNAELYNGKVVFKMPNLAHGVIQINISEPIRNYLKTNPIGLVSGDTNFRLWPERATSSRAPDVSFILNERLPEDLYRYPAMAPDLAVEILSPGDGFEQVMEKVDEYLSQGVKVVWVIISRTREVLVCTHQSKHIVRDVLSAPELLPGFELPVQEIFVGLEKVTS